MPSIALPVPGVRFAHRRLGSLLSILPAAWLLLASSVLANERQEFFCEISEVTADGEMIEDGDIRVGDQILVSTPIPGDNDTPDFDGDIPGGKGGLLGKHRSTVLQRDSRR